MLVTKPWSKSHRTSVHWDNGTLVRRPSNLNVLEGYIHDEQAGIYWETSFIQQNCIHAGLNKSTYLVKNCLGEWKVNTVCSFYKYIQ